MMMDDDDKDGGSDDDDDDDKSQLLYMEDLKLIDKMRKYPNNKCKQLEPSMMISIQNLDLKSVQWLYSRKENYFTCQI